MVRVNVPVIRGECACVAVSVKVGDPVDTMLDAKASFSVVTDLSLPIEAVQTYLTPTSGVVVAPLASNTSRLTVTSFPK